MLLVEGIDLCIATAPSVTPEQGFGLRLRLFLPFGPKKRFMLFYLMLGYFWCLLVTSLIFSSYLGNLEKGGKLKYTNNIQKIKNSKLN